MRKATIRRWTASTILLVGLILLSPSLRAESPRVEDLCRLAVACEQRGDRPNAILHYQRSLQLDPNNDNARQHLKQLGAAALASQ